MKLELKEVISAPLRSDGSLGKRCFVVTLSFVPKKIHLVYLNGLFPSQYIFLKD